MHKKMEEEQFVNAEGINCNNMCWKIKFDTNLFSVYDDLQNNISYH